MVVRVLQRICRCIMLKVLCHECLYEYCEGSIIVLYLVLHCLEFFYDYYEGSIVVLY
jgi:hypothetical protein